MVVYNEKITLAKIQDLLKIKTSMCTWTSVIVLHTYFCIQKIKNNTILNVTTSFLGEATLQYTFQIFIYILH